MQNALFAVVGNVPVGATDSRLFRVVTPTICLFSQTRIRPSDFARARGPAERASADHLAELVTFCRMLVRHADGGL